MNITILGSTGSIGTQALDIVRRRSDIKVKVLTANKNSLLMEKQIREFSPELVCMSDENAAADLRVRAADCSVKITSGTDGMCEAAAYHGSDTVLTAVVGISGLLPTIAAIESGKNIALANKETMVTAGHIVTALAKKNCVRILPVDSEHSAVFQSMHGRKCDISRLILTASGGPLFGMTREQLRTVTAEQALHHPNWDMGAKVTVDSATLVNKGLEVMEAHWLFDVDYDRIDVLVHRQSVIHSMVEYVDGAVMAQLGVPDMHLPIQYALSYPERWEIPENRLDFSKYSELTFAKPDICTFPALGIAYHAGKTGGVLPTVFNGADEAAVAMFLSGKIKFTEIADVIEKAVSSSPVIPDPTVDDILEADRFARTFAL